MIVSAALGQQGARRRPGRIGNRVPGQHARDLVHAVGPVKRRDGRSGHVARHLFLDPPMVSAKRRDLRRMGHDKDLTRRGEGRQAPPHGIGGGAPDAAVDLVKDHRQSVAVAGQADLQRQKEARQFPARGDAAKRTGRRAGIGGDGELDLVDAIRAGIGQLQGGGKDRALHLQRGQFGGHCRVEPSGGLGPLGPKLFGAGKVLCLGRTQRLFGRGDGPCPAIDEGPPVKHSGKGGKAKKPKKGGKKEKKDKKDKEKASKQDKNAKKSKKSKKGK